MIVDGARFRGRAMLVRRHPYSEKVTVPLTFAKNVVQRPTYRARKCVSVTENSPVPPVVAGVVTSVSIPTTLKTWMPHPDASLMSVIEPDENVPLIASTS